MLKTTRHIPASAENESETKNRILNAMYSLVAEQGYDKASIRKVCALAEVTQPTVYYHFGSKEGLFLSMAESLYPDLSTETLDFNSLETPEQYVAYLLEMGYKIIDGYRNDEERRRVLAEIETQGSRIQSINVMHKSQNEVLKESFAQLIRYGVRIGALPEDTDVAVKADFLYIVIYGISDATTHHQGLKTHEIWSHAVHSITATS